MYISLYHIVGSLESHIASQKAVYTLPTRPCQLRWDAVHLASALATTAKPIIIFKTVRHLRATKQRAVESVADQLMSRCIALHIRLCSVQ